MVQLVGLFSFVNILNSTAAQRIYTLPASFALPDTIYYNIVFIYFLFKYESEEKSDIVSAWKNWQCAISSKNA